MQFRDAASAAPTFSQRLFPHLIMVTVQEWSTASAVNRMYVGSIPTVHPI